MFPQLLILKQEDLIESANSVNLTSENILNYYKGSLRPIQSSYLVLFILNDDFIVVKNTLLLDNSDIEIIVDSYKENPYEFDDFINRESNFHDRSVEPSSFSISGLNFFG